MFLFQGKVIKVNGPYWNKTLLYVYTTFLLHSTIIMIKDQLWRRMLTLSLDILTNCNNVRGAQVQIGDLHQLWLIVREELTFRMISNTVSFHNVPLHKTLALCLCSHACWVSPCFADRNVPKVNLTKNSIQFRHKGKGGTNQGRKVLEGNLWQKCCRFFQILAPTDPAKEEATTF